MLKVDATIFDICENISSNIDKLSDDVGLLSQNVLSQLRNLVEAIISKIYIFETGLGDCEVDFDKTITPGIKHLKGKYKYKFLIDFHNSLKISVSHYTIDENGSERLIYKYLEYLIKSINFLKDMFNFELLNNLTEFPLNKNKDLYEYYGLISEKIDISGGGIRDEDYNDRYYVHKKRPFFIKGRIYYEITVIEARDKYSKFDRFVFYTGIDINPYYAIKIKTRRESINYNGLDIPIIIVNDYQVSIRPCEIDNYAKVLGIKTKTNTIHIDYRYLTEYLKKTKYSIVDIINFDDYNFEKLVKNIDDVTRLRGIINILTISREKILNGLKGQNILKLLLLNLNNMVIKKQSNHGRNLVNSNPNLSGLFLHNGCIPFEEMPYCTSPIKTNVSIYQLFEIIDPDGREHELLARFLKNKAEKEKQIYTDINELKQFDDISNLISTYNSKLYSNSNHQSRRIEMYKDKIYINSYDTSVAYIIRELIELSKTGLENYKNSVISWQKETDYEIDSEEKQKVLLNAFEDSKMFAIYGAAGTGKTKMLEHFSIFFHKQKKIFLSNTHASLENLKRRIKVENSSFYSVKNSVFK